MAASRHGNTPYSGKPVTSGSVTPYTTSVDVNVTPSERLASRQNASVVTLHSRPSSGTQDSSMTPGPSVAVRPPVGPSCRMIGSPASLNGYTGVSGDSALLSTTRRSRQLSGWFRAHSVRVGARLGRRRGEVAGAHGLGLASRERRPDLRRQSHEADPTDRHPHLDGTIWGLPGIAPMDSSRWTNLQLRHYAPRASHVRGERAISQP